MKTEGAAQEPQKDSPIGSQGRIEIAEGVIGCHEEERVERKDIGSQCDKKIRSRNPYRPSLFTHTEMLHLSTADPGRNGMAQLMTENVGANRPEEHPLESKVSEDTREKIK